MARIIPPTSLLYWPNSIMFISSRMFSYVDFQREQVEWENYWVLSGNMFYRITSDSYSLATRRKLRLYYPGNYLIQIEICNNMQFAVVLNGTTVYSTYARPGEVKTLNVKLFNVPAWSILELQWSGSGSTGYCGFRNYKLISSSAPNPKLEAFTVIWSGESFTLSSSSQTITDFETNSEQILPPPKRFISNAYKRGHFNKFIPY